MEVQDTNLSTLKKKKITFFSAISGENGKGTKLKHRDTRQWTKNHQTQDSKFK